jgi:GTP cyclohydrolase II
MQKPVVTGEHIGPAVGTCHQNVGRSSSACFAGGISLKGGTATGSTIERPPKDTPLTTTDTDLCEHGKQRLGSRSEGNARARLSMPSGDLKRIATADFPTPWGQFRLLAFADTRQRATTPCRPTALALIAGSIDNSAPIVRIHSQCITGDALHSLRCDCHDQLHLALQTIAEAGNGILVYEQQEGRGIGLIEKIKAYELQDLGLDTIEANLQLGHEIDLRDYRLAVDILHDLGVQSVRLMTNNPDKLAAVESSGIRVVERLSADVPVDPRCAPYLRTKRDKLGHLFGSLPEFPVQTDDARHGAR